MFYCTLSRHVIAKDAEADFKKHIELSFIPSIGMEIWMDGENDDFDFIKVEKLRVFIPSNELAIEETFYMSDCCKCKQEDSCCTLDTSLFEVDGWTLDGEVRRGADRNNLNLPWIYKY